MQILSRLKDKLSQWELFNLLTQFQQVVNGGIELGTTANTTINVKGKIFNGTTPGVADTEFSITHNFGYIPTGIITLSVDKAGVIYKGVSAWTTKQVFLKCNQTSVNYILFLT